VHAKRKKKVVSLPGPERFPAARCWYSRKTGGERVKRGPTDSLSSLSEERGGDGFSQLERWGKLLGRERMGKDETKHTRDGRKKVTCQRCGEPEADWADQVGHSNP